MNGPEHYTEAERLLAVADSDVSLNWSTNTGETKADILAAAQVHATLALAAATAGGSAAWRPILGPPPLHGGGPDKPDRMPDE